MFDRPHHQAISDILYRLNPQVLDASDCWFAGGTAIALLRNEYRQSSDIDLMVSNNQGYRTIRGQITAAGDLNPITTAPVELIREVRADQYGIRTVVDSGGVPIKFEIILEGRIDFGPATNTVCEVPTLSDLDLAASKMLANDDRWADKSVHSRDIIDLAMLDLDPATLHAAMSKAIGAYSSIPETLAQAIDWNLGENSQLRNFINALGMDEALEPVLVERFEYLRRTLT